MSIELRTFAFLDQMQPQFASFVASTARGYLPVAGQAALYVEIAPGIAINRLTDVALKSTGVRPAVQVVERAYGLLAVHSESQAEVLEAGQQMLRSIERREADRLRPNLLSKQIITDVDDHQTMLLNRGRGGSMVQGGQTIYILEVHPAGYAALAANEAEKASPITIVDLRPYGAYGRLYLSGTEAAIGEAAAAVEKVLAGVSGRANEEEKQL